MAVFNNLNDFWTQQEIEWRRTITVTEVSDATGVSRDTLTRWRNGTITRYDEGIISKLCEFFDIPPGPIPFLVYEPDTLSELEVEFGHFGVHTQIGAVTPRAAAGNIKALGNILSHIDQGKLLIIDQISGVGDPERRRPDPNSDCGFVDWHCQKIADLINELNHHRGKFFLAIRLDADEANVRLVNPTNPHEPDRHRAEESERRYKTALRKFVSWVRERDREDQDPDRKTLSAIIVGNEVDHQPERRWALHIPEGSGAYEWLTSYYAPEYGRFMKELCQEFSDLVFIGQALSGNANIETQVAFQQSMFEPDEIPNNFVAGVHGYYTDLSPHGKTPTIAKELRRMRYKVAGTELGGDVEDIMSMFRQGLIDLGALWVLHSQAHMNDPEARNRRNPYVVDEENRNDRNALKLAELVGYVHSLFK
jgi:transcriptional regulator with XRE-family HTH domain